MNPVPLKFIGCILAAASIGMSHGQMRDAATNKDLVPQFRKASLQDPLKNLKKKELKGPDPSTVNQPRDLFENSDFLSFQGYATLVPKKAILVTPRNFQDRVRYVAGSKIIPWIQFCEMNRGWIKTFEVTRAQAEGNEPFAEEVAENLKKGSVLVVATYKGGAISVLPQKEKSTESNAKAE